MPPYQTNYAEQIQHEVEQTPDEYLPLLLEMVHLFRRGLTLKPATESFRQGWEEAMRGEALPITELWTGDYTQEREQLFADLTLDDIVAEIKRERKSGQA